MCRLNKAWKKAAQKEPSRPLWKGPSVDGITQSLLSEFLICRERFRLRVIDGLQVKDEFYHPIEFGNFWHLCEESLQLTGLWKVGEGPWTAHLKDYAKELCRRYPLKQDQIIHWMNICALEFPIYLDYWKKHPDQENKQIILAEISFRVPYTLPSGRIVTLRGKWDAVNQIGRKRDALVYLQENKTKGEIDEEALRRQLDFDLQTMFYLVALHTGAEEYNIDPKRIAGVHYNVVRRPLGGGKYSIRQHQATKTNPQGESLEDFYQRLAEAIRSDPAYFFMRWKAEIDSADRYQFCRQFLDPILEQLCDWWEYMSAVNGPGGSGDCFDRLCQNGSKGIHWRTPYGLWNPMANNRGTELDEYLKSGSTAGLERTPTLFGELNA